MLGIMQKKRSVHENYVVDGEDSLIKSVHRSNSVSDDVSVACENSTMTMMRSDEQGQSVIIMSNYNTPKGSNYNSNTSATNNGSNARSISNTDIMTSLHYQYQQFYAGLAETHSGLINSPSNVNSANNHTRMIRNDMSCNTEGGSRKNGEGQSSKPYGKSVGFGFEGEEGGGNTNGKPVNSDAAINSSGDDDAEISGSGEKPQSRKMPFYYCKTAGWDPVLNKFHIQLGAMDVR